LAFEDKQLVCADCGRSFTFTAGEQEFYASRGLLNEPRRCPEDRAARKQRRGTDGGSRVKEMYPATCANCGNETQVPFRPTGIRPVYCSDCFSQIRA